MPRATAQVRTWTKERINSLLEKPASKGTFEIPKELDYVALGEDLEWIETLAVVLPEITDKSLSRHRHRGIRQAKGLCEKLIKLLEHDQDWLAAEIGLDQRVDQIAFPHQAVESVFNNGMDDLLTTLHRLADGLSHSLARRSEAGEDGGPPLTLDTSTAIALVARLKDVATKHLAMNVGVSRPSNGGPINGPFVRFCEGFAANVGTKLNGEVIAKALTSIKNRTK